MPRKFLTFDLGTTLYKVAVFDEAGKMLALERATPPIERPDPHWAEVDAAAFIRVLREALDRLRQRVSLDDVVAACSATQANSFLLTDKDGQPITPFILWSDERAMALTDELRRIVPGASPLLALAKLLWLRQHRPDVIAKARDLWFIGDYLTHLGATEAGVAALARIYDLRNPPPSRECGHLILKAMQLEHIDLPHVLQAGTGVGPRELKEQLGLSQECHTVIGCLDQYAGAIGTGTIGPGLVCETTGTVLAAVRCSDQLEAALPQNVVQGPAFDEDKFFRMSFSSTSANLLEWYRGTLTDRPSFEELSRLAAGADDAVVIEPYREGEPIESCFRQVRKEHSVGQVVRGIMQCVAEALKRQVVSLSPKMPATIRSAGGAARSDVWLQIKADVLGTTIEAVDCEEPTSMGAAMLAARAMTGRSMAELARDWVRVRARFQPR
jgi:xylulokinase